MIILLEYICINIWIGLITILLWINDGEFSIIDRNIIFILAIAGTFHIRSKIKEYRKKQYSAK
ncbi:hypothetical protein [Paenibacillus piri]|uniref:Uncharacterized protein n=1 Tax=Paenibacillus piri TaxID=2547395 RepID=A0A4R5K6R5_9BACL|nr:hypothetical protein [Paenibacillus piri]TDF88914.1 hypothetical protein E1757_35060 [Paenibacillus piri]